MEILGHLSDVDAVLLHRIAVTDGDFLVVQAIEVERDAERSSDLVLAAIALTDALAVVVSDVEIARELGEDTDEDSLDASTRALIDRAAL